MGALAIAGVDPATDQLNIVAHGLNTGDGFMTPFVAPGFGAIPGGLAALNDYWAIVVDANHIKLASSSANAMSGTAVDITSPGAGTLFMLSGQPFRIPNIAAAGQLIKHADVNGGWQGEVSIWNWITGQATPPAPFDLWSRNPPRYTVAQFRELYLDDAFDNTSTIAMATHARSLSQIILAASATPVYLPIRGMVPDDVITTVAINAVKATSAANTLTADLVYWDSTGEHGSGAPWSSSANAPGAISLSAAGLSIRVASGRRYYLKVTPGGSVAPAADRISDAQVAWNHTT